MSHDTQVPPSRTAALAVLIGAIADTTDWNHTDWQALAARLLAYGVPAEQLTLGQVHDAIAAVRAAHQGGEA